jgi:hypothetical protein
VVKDSRSPPSGFLHRPQTITNPQHPLHRDSTPTHLSFYHFTTICFIPIPLCALRSSTSRPTTPSTLPTLHLYHLGPTQPALCASNLHIPRLGVVVHLTTFFPAPLVLLITTLVTSRDRASPSITTCVAIKNLLSFDIVATEATDFFVVGQLPNSAPPA